MAIWEVHVSLLSAWHGSFAVSPRSSGAGPPVLPAVRHALQSGDASARERCIRILAWQGDGQALDLLRGVSQAHPEQRALIDWAMNKIDTLQVSAGQAAGSN